MMRRILFGLVLSAVVLSFAGIGWAKTIQGELTKIDGSFYVVKDGKDQEHRVHFNDSTVKNGDIKPGVHVEIDEADGHANSIKVMEMEMEKGMKGMK